MQNMKNYNPWDVPNQGTSQHQQPPKIGDCIGFTNSESSRNYYDPYANYRNYYGYNMYYNPYEIRKRQEEEEQRQKQTALNQLKFRHDLDKSYYAFIGVNFEQETPEEKMEHIQKEYEFIQEYANMMREHEMFQFQSDFHILGTPRPQKEQVEIEKEHVDVHDWINNMGYEYAKIEERKAYEQSKNLNSAYDSSVYNNLIRNFNNNSSSTIDALTSDFTIDDMEIRLPDEFDREYKERRARFMNALMT